ncbi:MAG TPA: CPBP family intramembrane glutamic endopeptidase [Polyangiaceae bacterium]|nr:CPBP family intramembrane glutamic endopeptidase [Polyangiaceae bacterium]
MGWQPLVAVWAVRRWVDPSDAPGLGLRRAPWSFTVVGGVAALGVTALAALVAALAAALGLGSAPLLHGDATAGFAADVRPAWALASLALTFFGTLVLVWAQSLAEEVAWRGYVLPRMMERLGAWRGLVSHGAAWGLWYAPVLFFATYEPLAPSTSLGRSAGFVLTCVLLGTLLGWLRLAARSLVPAVVTNAVLTLAAGLPSFVHGLDAGLRSAALGPAGWLVLLATIGGLSLSRWRSAVRPPPPLAPLSGVRPAPHALVVILPPGAALPNRHLN